MDLRSPLKYVDPKISSSILAESASSILAELASVETLSLLSCCWVRSFMAVLLFDRLSRHFGLLRCTLL